MEFPKKFSILVIFCALLSCPKLSATEITFTEEQIEAETLEIGNIINSNFEAGLLLLDQRIDEARDDEVRLLHLYLTRGHYIQDMGSEGLEAILAKITPLIDKGKDPNSYIGALCLQAYNMSAYKNQNEEAINLLESVENLPILDSDVYLLANYTSCLLTPYYKSKQYNKIAKPLFRMVKALKKIRFKA